MPERLDKLLAGTGYYSRKQVKELVRQGRVSVDGVSARSPQEKVHESANIMVDAQTVECARHCYVMVHKPAGLLSATEDKTQKTVLSLLPPHLQKRALFPVGRLDKDTTGLLMLTDDGELAHRLLAPKSHVDKVYLATVRGRVDSGDVAAFAAGLTLGDGMQCMPAGLEILGEREQCLVTLHEGKFHQVKRMLAARGKPVTALKRIKFGSLVLEETLQAGQWRELREQELTDLQMDIV